MQIDRFNMLNDILLNVVGKNNAELKKEFLKIINILEHTEKSAKNTKDSNNTINNLASMQDLQRAFRDIHDSNLMLSIIKVFSLQNVILNICEELEDVNNISQKDLELAYKTLLDEGFDKQDCDIVLSNVKFYPVFTAHPTESRRRTFLEAHREISQLLKKLDSITFMPQNESTQKNIDEIKENIAYRLHLLYQTDLVRSEKINVRFELDNLLYIIENSLLPSSLDVLNEVSNKLGIMLKKTPIKLGSWIGGDRDGNPIITNEIMTGIMKAQHELIINIYIKEIDKIYRELSISTDFCEIKKDLVKFLQRYSDQLNPDLLRMNAREPFRLGLSIVRLKLKNHLLKVNSNCDIDFTYNHPKELLRDLEILIDSMDEIGAKRLKNFRNLVLLGGFHLMQLDFREHKDSFINALSEILSINGLCDSDYALLDENRKMDILNNALSLPPINLYEILPQLSAQSRRCVDAFLRVKWAKQHISKQILKSFIVSMSSNASDLMSVLYLAKASGLWQKDSAIDSKKDIIHITPLFETIDDLDNAKIIMQTLSTNKHYAKYLKDCNGVQEIMIGYSDSSKDGGIFTSNYSLHKAISNLVKLENTLGIRFLLFHGKGGSIARGGGDLESALLAFPSGSIGTTLKVTEQGETISSKYLNDDIARESLFSTLSSLLKKCVYDNFGGNANLSGVLQNSTCSIDPFLSKLEKLSMISYKTYRNLVYETPGFMEFFKQFTPIDFISQLNIGSRPSKRKDSKNIEDLRAIPWVFAWTQNRSIMPSWYGLGSALQGIDDKDMLRECYKDSLFFKTTIDNITQGFLKVDLDIAMLYADFVTNEDLKNNICSKIKIEYEKTKQWLLIVRNESEILDSNMFLRNKILGRMSNLKALNLLQIELIRKYKHATYASLQNRLIEQIHATIIGIAQGIRNTG